MKYALIGCGRVSPNHIVAATKNNLELVGLCDVSKNAVYELKEKYPLIKNVKFYKDYKKLLEEQKPELVAIATESGKHADIAVDCINAGCNVIIEKPIALSIKDADRIIEAAERMGVKVAANHQNRFNASIQKIHEAVEQGRFGKIFHGTTQIRWSRGESYYKQASWRGTWEMDGGALMNQCIHNIDLLNWMLGEEPTEVIAMTDNLNHSYIEGEDIGLAIVRYKNGAYGVVEGTVNVYGGDMEEALCLFGENGTVKADGTINNIIENWRFADEKDDEEEVKREFSVPVDHIYGKGHTALYADMIDAIVNNRKPLVDMYSGKKALELVLAICKSSFEKKAVSLPLEQSSTLDFKGMFNKE